MGEIGPGLLVLLGVAQSDTERHTEQLAAKIAGLRLFGDGGERFERSLTELGGEALVISQFTLLADVRKGRRPSFMEAARPKVAEPLIDLFIQALRGLGIRVSSGRFGAHMEVELLNDGPVTLVIDSGDLEKPRAHSRT